MHVQIGEKLVILIGTLCKEENKNSAESDNTEQRNHRSVVLQHICQHASVVVPDFCTECSGCVTAEIYKYIHNDKGEKHLNQYIQISSQQVHTAL